MSLLVINPNSSSAMTALIERTVGDIGASGLRVVHPPDSPPAIETTADEAAATAAMLAMLAKQPQLLEGIDSILIACYGDPGLDEVATATRLPVRGIAELSMAVAASLDPGFGLVVAKPSAVDIMGRLARRHGHRLGEQRIRASGAAVLEMLEAPAEAYPRVRAAVEDVRAGGASVVCLGCASMGRFAPRLRLELGVVIDPVATAVAVLQGYGTVVDQQVGAINCTSNDPGAVTERSVT